jgi:hypothetical protein
MTPIEQFASVQTPGAFVAYPNASLNAKYDAVAKVFEPSAAARAEPIYGNGATHMADWWSHISHDAATDSYWIAGGRDRNRALPQNLVSYHAAVDVWTHRPNWSGKGGGHCYNSTCVGGGKVWSVTSTTGTIEMWDIATDAYAGSMPVPNYRICTPYSNGWGAGTALAFAHAMGAQGSLLWVTCASTADPLKRLVRIARYDVALATWFPVYSFKGDLWNNQHQIALPSRHLPITLVGATVAAEQKALGTLDAAGVLTLLPVGPMSLSAAGSSAQRGMVVEHPERNEWIVFCLATNRIWSLPPGGVWTDRGPLLTQLQGGYTVVMPTTFGAVGVRYRSGAALSEMWVWKPDF